MKQIDPSLLKLPFAFANEIMRRVFEEKLQQEPYNLSDFRREYDVDAPGGLGFGYRNPQTDLAWRMYVHGANAMYEVPPAVLTRIKEM